MRHVLRGDGAVGAQLVVDRDGLTEEALHPVGDEPRGGVGGAARRKRNDEPHRTRRISSAGSLPATPPVRSAAANAVVRTRRQVIAQVIARFVVKDQTRIVAG